MKIDYVIMSSTTNPYYLDFWPIVSKIWKVKFNVTPILFLVGDGSITPTEEFGKVVHFKPVADIPLHIQAQCSRYWYPIKDLNATWITSDIDMLPISKKYFINSLESISNDKFVNMNAKCIGLFPCCYNVATGQTFKEILHLPETYEEFLKQIKWTECTYHHVPQNQTELMMHWGADEQHCNKMVNLFPDKNRFVLTTRHGNRPRDTCSLRVDRQYWNRWSIDKVVTEHYIDAHCPRPYSSHKADIDRLVNGILK